MSTPHAATPAPNAVRRFPKIRVDPETVRVLDALRGDEPRHRFVRRVLAAVAGRSVEAGPVRPVSVRLLEATREAASRSARP